MGNSQVLSKKSENIEKYFADFAHWSILGELSGQILHELNNPLQVVLGFAQELQESFPEKSSHYSDISLIIEEARKCCQIVKSIESFHGAKEEEGYQDLELMLTQIIPLLQYRMRKKRLKIDLQVKSIDLVKGSGNLIQAFVLSALLAAIENSVERKTIEVLACMGGNTISLEIHYNPSPKSNEVFLHCKENFFELLENYSDYRLEDSLGKYTLIFPRLRSTSGD